VSLPFNLLSQLSLLSIICLIIYLILLRRFIEENLIRNLLKDNAMIDNPSSIHWVKGLLKSEHPF